MLFWRIKELFSKMLFPLSNFMHIFDISVFCISILPLQYLIPKTFYTVLHKQIVDNGHAYVFMYLEPSTFAYPPSKKNEIQTIVNYRTNVAQNKLHRSKSQKDMWLLLDTYMCRFLKVAGILTKFWNLNCFSKNNFILSQLYK